MSNFVKRLLMDLERTFESRCNNIRAECGLDMCTGQEECYQEPCLLICPMKPLRSLTTIQEADGLYKSRMEVSK